MGKIVKSLVLFKWSYRLRSTKHCAVHIAQSGPPSGAKKLCAIVSLPAAQQDHLCIALYHILCAKEKRATAMSSPRHGVDGRRLVALRFRASYCRGTQHTIWPSGDGALPRGECGCLRCPLVVIGHFAEIDGGCPSMLLLLKLLSAATTPPLAVIV